MVKIGFLYLRKEILERKNLVLNQFLAVFESTHFIFRYNNQFMVLDYKKFSPGKPLPKAGLFWVLEQIP